MNEYGQVVAWWFTNGTGMAEIQLELRKLNHRYSAMGYDEPATITTDRCCQERQFWKDIFTLMDDHEIVADELDESVYREVETVELPSVPRIPAVTEEITSLYVSQVSEYLESQQAEQRIIAVDCEWKIGKARADLLQIALWDGRVFLFHLARIGRMPNVLKHLLQSNTVNKVGNRICNEVKKLEGWGVKLEPTLELGHLAKARGLTPTKGPSLDLLVSTLFDGVKLDGKDGGGPRRSDWGRPLSQQQIEYASIDAYATITCYKRNMQFMDPRVEGRLRQDDIVDGQEVSLYSRGWKTRVAEATICNGGTQPRRNKVTVKLDLHSNIHSTGALVEYFCDDELQTTTIVSIASLKERFEESDSSIVKIAWPIALARRQIQPSDNAKVEIKTRTRHVLKDPHEEDEVLMEQNYDGDHEEETWEDRNDDSSVGEEDNSRNKG